MPLSDDQKAMLRLLAQREQGYDDLAALMGLSVDEVRVKVKDALGQLEAEGKAAPPGPVEPPPAELPKRSEPVAEPEPVEEPLKAAPPPPPAAPEKPAPAPAPAPRPEAPVAKRPSSSRPRPSLPSDPGARAAVLAGAGVLLVLVVLLVTGVFGGSSGGDTTTGVASGGGALPPETEAGPNNTTASSKQVTQAILKPVGGANAEGVAVFGRVKNTLALQIEAKGLAPTGKGQSYTVWLAQSPQKMLPLATTTVDKTGTIGAQVEVPTEVLGFLAKGTFDQIVVSLTSDSTLKAALAKATSEKKAPIYTGTNVLQGTITGPIVGAANKAGG